MARSTRLVHLLALLALLLFTLVHAQGDLPDLATATNTNGDNTNANTAEPTREASTAASTGDATSAAPTAESSTENTAEPTGETTAQSTDNSAATTATFPDATSSTSAPLGRLTGLPTIAGAGVPTLVIPYTANAPFMQKSSMPEGTVFIAVGAVLAFLGACVLLWRGLVAWSINRSVKRAALASIRGSEKNWGSGAAYGTGKSGYYKEYEAGSSMSLDHLTAAGKTQKSGKHGHDDSHRNSSAPPAGLFFSPTAQASNRVSSYNADNRNSAYLPAGYYASPSAESPAGGRHSTVIGGSLAPYARHSGVGHSPSPPGSPSLPNSRSTSAYYGGAGDSRAGLRQSSRENLRAPPSRDGYGGSRGSHMYMRPSSSSLQVGQSTSDLPGQRAPSAVLDEMFENHGHGPRERF